MGRLESPAIRATVTTRVDETIRDDLDRIAEREGKNRSEKVAELIRDEVANHSDDVTHDTPKVPPNDEQLATAYGKLYEIARDRKDHRLRVKKVTARNDLYTNEIPKDSVMNRLIYPLQQRGYVQVRPAMETVWLVL